jgi:hypothetical protein
MLFSRFLIFRFAHAAYQHDMHSARLQPRGDLIEIGLRHSPSFFIVAAMALELSPRTFATC